jgi:predicted phosphate transport protein (TIGR00153 family)
MNLLPVLSGEKSKGFYNAFDIYVQDVHKCVTRLREAIHLYCDGDAKAAEIAGKKVVNLEKKADFLRRDLEKNLYEGVLIPFGREDKYNLIEAIDDIADKAEIAVRLAKIAMPNVPKKLVPDMKLLADQVESTVAKLGSAVMLLNKDIDKAIKKAKEVELEREKVRETEFKIFEGLFSNAKGKEINALLLKDLVSLVALVADKTEEAADRVVVLSVKYES